MMKLPILFKNAHKRKAVFLSSCLITLVVLLIPWQGFPLWKWAETWYTGSFLHELGTNNRVIALTFDDGPDPACTPGILDTLRREGVHATFFVEGRMLEKYPDLAKRELREGHSIGNHTFSHPYLERKTASEVRKELETCDNSIFEVLQLRTSLFRPPRGSWNPAIVGEARREGKQIVLWSGAVEHHDAVTPEQLTVRAVSLAHPGAILLLHDGSYGERINTMHALPGIIHELKKQGYSFVTLPMQRNAVPAE